MKKILILSLLLGFSQLLVAQELRCIVSVSSSKVQSSEKHVFDNLQTTIYEFMNNRSWTNYKYQEHERIECNIFIRIDDWNNSDKFKGSIQIQSSRPVFDASYKTTMLNINDKDLEFEWLEYDPIDFVENNAGSNLASILAYYAYMIIGYDFDSFTLNGGSPFYTKAEAIVTTAQSGRYKSGWLGYGSKNRYWLVNNILNSRYSKLRTSNYHYHRNGLDMMYEKPEIGRAKILEQLEDLNRVKKDAQYLYALDVFILAKSDELVSIFTEAPSFEKSRAVQLLSGIDPSNASKYEKITKSN